MATTRTYDVVALQVPIASDTARSSAARAG
ncbi:hypothetical protein F4561_003501 [Lipingzhangella halophila]|uniref:Uncharacterized protein n=1 Tax=Lipingzhangella halophila TaxID=1783352 RepID=A0A7W7RJM1_9ACTN|nr:hypothetical protein [Lipingzhangella halophila]